VVREYNIGMLEKAPVPHYEKSLELDPSRKVERLPAEGNLQIVDFFRSSKGTEIMAILVTNLFSLRNLARAKEAAREHSEKLRSGHNRILGKYLGTTVQHEDYQAIRPGKGQI